MKPIYIFFLLFVCLLDSCTESVLPQSVEAAVNVSGNNRSELLKVIQHYSYSPADSLKLKATYFLIANMTDWYYYQGKQLSGYQQYTVPRLLSWHHQHDRYFLEYFKD